MKNAKTAYDWMSGVVNEPSLQFVASTAIQKTDEFGISRDHVLDLEGRGRYSLGGPIGPR